MISNFKKMDKVEKRASLLNVILKRTEGKLSKKQLETIINKLDIKNRYKIIVTNDSKEFNKFSKLINEKMEHSWAGEIYTIEKAYIVFGEIKFGQIYAYEYSNNGNLETDKKSECESNFDINNTICFIKSKHEYSDFNNNNYDTYENIICIYLGDNDSYKIKPEIQYIIDNFNIVGNK